MDYELSLKQRIRRKRETTGWDNTWNASDHCALICNIHTAYSTVWLCKIKKWKKLFKYPECTSLLFNTVHEEMQHQRGKKMRLCAFIFDFIFATIKYQADSFFSLLLKDGKKNNVYFRVVSCTTNRTHAVQPIFCIWLLWHSSILNKATFAKTVP